MPDREKVIEAFDELKELVWRDDDEYTVGYNDGLEAGKNIALALLKEQNPITQNNGSCPNCGWDFENGDLEFSSLDSQKFYCPNCGQALKWG